ncbi:MAG TPA: CPBP family glutamic-type intramembrane protease [Anaerolineales bacterium]|nr:CPBP family glutamic-type intramembrane protease [Anaerolineales bacterium]
MTQTVDKNTIASIKTLYSASSLSWWPVIFFLPARLVFAFISQSLTAALFAFRGSTNAWQDATAWWPVYSTITDLLCLFALVWLMRREKMKINDLIGAKGKDILKQLAWTPAYLLAVAPTSILASIITQAFYGTALPPMITVVNLSPIGELYSLIIWPIIWVITEELVYLGYLLPRIEALSGKTWVAVLVVIFFWGIQHLAMPFILNEKYLVSRILAAIAAISSFPIVFVLGRRRLVPLIGVHYIADLATAILIGF